MRWMLICSVFLMNFSTAKVRAGDPCKECDRRLPRAEAAQKTACYAVRSETKHYVGYYVGGGCLCSGRTRCPDEGTWGWDYRGCPPLHKVLLNWCCKYQGGTGAYATTGHGLGSHSTP